MYFKNIVRNSVLILSVVLISLYISGNLTLYVHPRYELFTVTFAAISLIAHLLSLDTESSKKIHRSEVLILWVTLTSLLLPPNSLTTSTAENRSQQSQITNKVVTLSSYDKFNQDFSYFDVADLSAILSKNPTEDQIVGKQAEVEGFLFKDTSDQYYIARFKLSCCAVDATPLVVPINLSNISDKLVIGNWYKTSGLFVTNDNTSSGHKYTIKLSSVQEIPEPEEPYVY